MATNEEKLTIENDTFALKREYKRASEQLAVAKSDAAEAIALRDKAAKELSELQAEATRVSNEISDERLAWAQHRAAELAEIADKESAAENVLKRKRELNEQEERIRTSEQAAVDARNEARRLELSIKERSEALDAKEREIEERIAKADGVMAVREKNLRSFVSKAGELLAKLAEISS